MTAFCPTCREPLATAPGADGPTQCPKCAGAVSVAAPETVRFPDAVAPSDPRAAAPVAPLPAAPLAAGAMIGPYRIVEPLGRGGMGVVYQALQVRLDRMVALKVLADDLAGDAEFVARFRREARVLANLNHPNIVAIHDMTDADGVLYLVMELVEGSSLRRIMREQRPEPAEALRLVAQVCAALAYAHSRNVVHRDIKPENLLVDSAGCVKVADFGLARMRGDSALASMTRTNVAMGTMEYMAPEQRVSSKSVDQRADLYSVGVVLYELLTGELPIGRFAPASRSAHTDTRVDEIIHKALEREPEQRYQSADELAADLHRVLGAERDAASGADAMQELWTQIAELKQSQADLVKAFAAAPWTSAAATAPPHWQADLAKALAARREAEPPAVAADERKGLTASVWGFALGALTFPAVLAACVATFTTSLRSEQLAAALLSLLVVAVACITLWISAYARKYQRGKRRWWLAETGWNLGWIELVFAVVSFVAGLLRGPWSG